MTPAQYNYLSQYIGNDHIKSITFHDGDLFLVTMHQNKDYDFSPHGPYVDRIDKDGKLHELLEAS